MKHLRTVVLIAFLLGIVALFFEQNGIGSVPELILLNLVDAGLIALILLEIIRDMHETPYLRVYVRKNIISLALAALFTAFYAYNTFRLFLPGEAVRTAGSAWIILVRNMVLMLKVYGRMRRVSGLLSGMSTHPAQTIIVSFLVVILLGTLVLMLGFTSTSGHGLSFNDSLFTVTSAVCVTGLIVVDTSTVFSVWGHLTILVLMQIGGLGIMILSFFSIYILRRSMTMEDRYLISYAMNEADMRSVGRSLRLIVGMTFGIEAVGALLLLIGFRGEEPYGALFPAVFHAVSAFCNAGFSLFGNSLEGYAGNALVNLTVASLIILGGASFIVLGEAGQHLSVRIRGLFRPGVRGTASPFSTNTLIVLIGSAILVVSAMIGIYALEHGNVLRGRPLGEQYLAAFFQSVTLRTAGFNTVPIGAMSTATSFFMMLFMLIGGASGSTAGGIKVNTVAIIGAAVAAGRDGTGRIVMGGRSLSMEIVLRSLMVFFLAVLAIGLGTLVLAISERASLTDILFETTSAFATVGLSRGLTSDLSGIGKMVIIMLMFIGRVGPLTILAASTARRTDTLRVSYPEAEIMIG